MNSCAKASVPLLLKLYYNSFVLLCVCMYSRGFNFLLMFNIKYEHVVYIRLYVALGSSIYQSNLDGSNMAKLQADDVLPKHMLVYKVTGFFFQN